MKYILALGVVLVLAIGGLIFWNQTTAQKDPESVSASPNPSQISQNTNSPNPSDAVIAQFSNPKKSAHYETNTPAHGSTLAGVPVNIVIDFNFDLAKPSEIKIIYHGSTGQIGANEWGIGETIIDQNKLSMRRTMNPESPDGLYTVEYNACWPDGSCHDGNFQFKIDRAKAQSFDDQTDKKEVVINMSQIKFMPMDLKISKGTKVTWVNDDSVDHYVNTDSHPAHTYYPDQNSKALKKGESYSVTFDMSGIYPYHCSAHAANMTGNILVQ